MLARPSSDLQTTQPRLESLFKYRHSVGWSHQPRGALRPPQERLKNSTEQTQHTQTGALMATRRFLQSSLICCLTAVCHEVSAPLCPQQPSKAPSRQQSRSLSSPLPLSVAPSGVSWAARPRVLQWEAQGSALLSLSEVP